jgi:hypothetical protein
MRIIMTALLVGMLLIISRTSEHTASVSDGSGNSTVVVWS